MSDGETDSYRDDDERYRARLAYYERAKAYLPRRETMSDDVRAELDKHLRWIRDGHECKNPECHYCEAAHHICKLFEELERERDETLKWESRFAIQVAERDARPDWPEVRDMLLKAMRHTIPTNDDFFETAADGIIAEAKARGE